MLEQIFKKYLKKIKQMQTHNYVSGQETNMKLRKRDKVKIPSIIVFFCLLGDGTRPINFSLAKML